MLAKRVDSWLVTDDFWQRVEPLIPQRAALAGKLYLRKPGAGRPPKPARQVFEGIVYVLRTGCQWKALPAERIGSASAIHKRFLECEKAGFFESIWKAGLAEYDELEGIAWQWQSVDGALMKAPLAQVAVGPNPTDRGKKWRTRHLLVDSRGVPLSIVVTAANVNDGKRLDEFLSAIVVKRKRPPVRRNKHLCADAGYRSAENLRIIDAHGYIAHVVDHRKEADINKPRHPQRRARRWVVELCHSWFNRFRKLQVRYEKLERSFEALNHLTAAIIALRKVSMRVNIICGQVLRQASRCDQPHSTMVFSSGGGDRSPAHEPCAWKEGEPKLALLQLQSRQRRVQRGQSELLGGGKKRWVTSTSPRPTAYRRAQRNGG